MIQTIKEWIWGKAPVLWFPDERIWEVVECEKMPSLVGMVLPTPTTKAPVKAESIYEHRTLLPTDVQISGDSLEVVTKHLKFKAKEKLARSL